MVLLVSLTVVVGFSGLGSAALVADGGTSQALDSDASNDNAGDHQNESSNDEDEEDDKGHGNECDNNDEDNPGNSTGPDNRTDNPHCEEEPDDGEDDGDDGNGDNGNETDGDNGNETDGDLGTCEQDGLVQNETIANSAFGTENEEGPISSELHANEEQFQELGVVVHEGSCVVATVDNNA